MHSFRFLRISVRNSGLQYHGKLNPYLRFLNYQLHKYDPAAFAFPNQLLAKYEVVLSKSCGTVVGYVRGLYATVPYYPFVYVSECAQRTLAIAIAIAISGDGSHHPTYLRITFVIYPLLPVATICK